MRQRIKTESPRLAKAVSPNFWAHIRPIAKRIIGRNRISEARIGMIDVNAQHLAQKKAQVLSVPLRILLRASIAHANIEKTIRPKRNAPAGMVLRHTLHFDQPA